MCGVAYGVRRNWCTRHCCTVVRGGATYDMMTNMKISAIIILSFCRSTESSEAGSDLVRRGDQDEEVYICGAT